VAIIVARRGQRSEVEEEKKRERKRINDELDISCRTYERKNKK